VDDQSQSSVDVLIVNYRSYDELGRCLESLDAQRTALQRVVVVDHESDADAVAQLARRFPWASVIERATNEGFATGINLAARSTHAAYLLLLNPDCVVAPSTCDVLRDLLDRHPDVAVAGPRIKNADGSVQPSARRFPGLTTAIAGRSSWLTRVLPGNPLSKHNLPARELSASSPVEVDWVSGACMLVRRVAYEAVGGLDEGFFLYWEDADFCRRLKRAGWRTMYVPSTSAIHVGARSSRHAARASLEAFHKSALRLYRKHTGPLGQLLTPLVFAGLQFRLAFMKWRVRRHRS
jgi:GT2 family glycosyltransferase